MTWLAFIFALEMGVVPQNSFVMYQREAQVFEYQDHYYYPISVSYTDTGPIFYTDLQAEVELFGFLFGGGGMRVQMVQDGAWNFDPQATFYEFRAGARWNGIEVFWHHCCRHPQMTYAYRYQMISGWEGAYTELGIRFKGRVGGKK